MQLEDALVRERGLGLQGARRTDSDAEGRPDRFIGIIGGRVGGSGVHGLPHLVEPAELPLVPGERPIALPDPGPGAIGVDPKMNGERASVEEIARLNRLDRSAAERDDARLPRAEDVLGQVPLEGPEVRLAALEELRNRPVIVLDDLVEVDEGAVDPPGDLSADGGLARTHETDEGEVPAERAYVPAD